MREDVTAGAEVAVREAMERMLTKKRHRLLVKLTGWPRMGFLKEIFPDAKFIQVYRDGRAVASSLIQKPWWSGWGGPSKWKWGELSTAHEQKWEKYGKSFVVLAGIQWEILMAAFEQAKQLLPAADVLEIRYEDLCENKVATLRSIIDFSGLSWSSQFETVVRRFPLINANDRYRRHLSELQQRQLGEALQDTLLSYGYAIAGPYVAQMSARETAGLWSHPISRRRKSEL